MAEILDRLRNYGIKGKRNSSNEYVGRCPVHNGKHDTFSVNLKTGFYICFSAKCGAKGHISKLVGKIEQEIAFEEVDFKEMFLRKEESEEIIRPNKAELEDWKLIHPYMLQRGFEKQFLMRNLIGYDRNHFSITIPVFRDGQEKGEYFGSIKRNIIPGFEGPKYTYPKGFPKKNLLYIPPFVTNNGKGSLGKILTVEGSINALRGAQNEFATASTLGCSPNEEQIHQLVKYANRENKRICWLYDNDESGIEGVKKLLRQHFWLDCDIANIETLKYVDNGKDLCYTMLDSEGNKVPKNDVDNLTRKELDYVVSQAKNRFDYEMENW